MIIKIYIITVTIKITRLWYLSKIIFNSIIISNNIFIFSITDIFCFFFKINNISTHFRSIEFFFIFFDVVTDYSRNIYSFIFTTYNCFYKTISIVSINVRYIKRTIIIHFTDNNRNHWFKFLWCTLTTVDHRIIRNRCLFNHISIIVNIICIIKYSAISNCFGNMIFLIYIDIFWTEQSYSILGIFIESYT